MERREDHALGRHPAARCPLLHVGDPGGELRGGTHLEPHRMPLAQDAKACARTLLSRLNSRGVEPPTRGPGGITEVRAPCPKVDAGGVGLGGVFRGPGEGCPSPRPDRVEPELAPDLPGGESFALDDTEPAVPAEPVPPAPAGLEPEREPDPTARDAHRG